MKPFTSTLFEDPHEPFKPCSVAYVLAGHIQSNYLQISTLTAILSLQASLPNLETSPYLVFRPMNLTPIESRTHLT